MLLALSLLALFGLLALAWWGALRTSFSLFLKIINENIHWEISFLSFVQSINLLSYGLLSIIIGGVLRKKPQYDVILLLIGAISIGTGLLLSAESLSKHSFFLFYGILFGLGATCFSPITLNAFIARTAGVYRPTLVGVATAGMGLGTMVLLPVVRYLLMAKGWEQTMRLLGNLTVYIFVPLCILIGIVTSFNKRSSFTTSQNYTPTRTNIYSGTALLLLAFPALEFFGIQMFLTHGVNMLVSSGISLEVATVMFACIGALNIAGRLLSGFFLQRGAVRLMGTMNYAGFFVGILGTLLLVYSHTWFFAILTICGIGVCWATIIPLTIEVITKRVGIRMFPLVYGASEAMIGFLGSAGVAVAGVIFDKFNAYQGSLLLAFACGIGSLWCYLKALKASGHA